MLIIIISIPSRQSFQERNGKEWEEVCDAPERRSSGWISAWASALTPFSIHLLHHPRHSPPRLSHSCICIILIFSFSPLSLMTLLSSLTDQNSQLDTFLNFTLILSHLHLLEVSTKRNPSFQIDWPVSVLEWISTSSPGPSEYPLLEQNSEFFVLLEPYSEIFENWPSSE